MHSHPASAVTHQDAHQDGCAHSCPTLPPCSLLALGAREAELWHGVIGSGTRLSRAPGGHVIQRPHT